MNRLPYGWRGVLHHVGTGGLTCERFASVCDGTSNTLAIGERHIKTNREERGTMWAATAVYYNAGTAVPQSRTLMVDYFGCKRIDPENYNECKRGWGSFHPGGINFVTVAFGPESRMSAPFTCVRRIIAAAPGEQAASRPPVLRRARRATGCRPRSFGCPLRSIRAAGAPR